MSKNQCVLVIGEGVADILGPTEKGYDVLNCHYAVEQVTDESGKTTPRLCNNGTVEMTLPQLPAHEIIEWGLTPGKCNDCAILVFDEENKLSDKTILRHTVCVDFKICYAQGEATQALTKLVLHPKKLIISEEFEIDN